MSAVDPICHDQCRKRRFTGRFTGREQGGSRAAVDADQREGAGGEFSCCARLSASRARRETRVDEGDTCVVQERNTDRIHAV